MSLELAHPNKEDELHLVIRRPVGGGGHLYVSLTAWVTGDA